MEAEDHAGVPADCGPLDLATVALGLGQVHRNRRAVGPDARNELLDPDPGVIPSPLVSLVRDDPADPERGQRQRHQGHQDRYGGDPQPDRRAEGRMLELPILSV